MGHLAVWQRLGCFFPLFNDAVVLSRTSRYMLTYMEDGGEGEWPYRTDKVLQGISWL